ncbi:MAG: hypothetical protein AB8G77_26135 [Rhodothermales bacterium]
MKFRIPGTIICALFALLVHVQVVKADWVNLTGAETSPNIAEIYIQENGVKLVLEIYIGDIQTTGELIPDDWLKEGETDRPSLAERLKHFSDNKFQFVTDSGEKLAAELLLAEPRLRQQRDSLFAGIVNPYTRRLVPEPPADKRVLYAELFYPFTGRPEALTMIPPLDEEGRAAIGVGFIVFHKSVPVIDFRYLGAPSQLSLDWGDPWYSKFDNRNLKRHHKSAMSSYLYVEPYEVRHEVLTRVKDLEKWMDLGLRGDQYIELEELDGLKQRIGEFFLAKNPVLIDGESIKPILDRTSYVKVGLRGIELLEKPERLDISTAIVGVIITYITDGIPRQVTVDWEMFPDQLQRIPATAIDPAGPFASFVTPEDARLTWTNYLKQYELPTIVEAAVDDTLEPLTIPIGTLLALAAILVIAWQIRSRAGDARLVGWFKPAIPLLLVIAVVSWPYARVSISRPAIIAGDLPDEKSAALLQTLLKSVYRAFDFRDEEDVYDKLALSVDGDLLADVYLQNRNSFAVQQAGGARAKIKEVEVIKATAESLENSTGYRIHGEWTAMGTVGHWGHLHQRKNRYDAIVTVEAVDDIWKITGLELLEEQRVDKAARRAQRPAEKKVNTTAQ